MKFLHVGCGPQDKSATNRVFASDDWEEIRFDINPDVEPDVIGTMTDMSAIEDGSMDALFSSHNVEHLYAHEVPLAFAEFNRVLAPDGFAVITCPDLLSVARLIAEDRLDEPAYHSPAGPITPLDVVFGHGASIAAGNTFMAHKTGFTQKRLVRVLAQAGFVGTASRARSEFFDLWALGTKIKMPDDDLRALAREHFL